MPSPRAPTRATRPAPPAAGIPGAGVFFRWVSAAVAVLAWGSLAAVAQEVRRAEPVASEDVPVRRALPTEPTAGPLEPFDFDQIKPVRRPTAARPPPVRPAATPAPTVARPAVAPDPRPTAEANPRLDRTGVPSAASPPPVRRPSSAPAPTPAPPPVPTPAGALTPEAAAAELPSAEESQLAYADGLYARKMYDLAAPEYERYLSDFVGGDGRQTALFRLGECYRQLGNTDRAAGTYDRLLGSFGAGEFVGPAAYRLAEISFAKKDYAMALPLFRRASVRLEEPRAVLSAKYYTARCLEALKLPAQARSVYEDILKGKGENPFAEVARLSLARLLLAADRKEDAVVQYEKLAKETENEEVRAESLVRCGLLYIELGKSKNAALHLRKALDLPGKGPWRELAQVGLIHTEYEAGRYKEVVAACEQALRAVAPERRSELEVLAANSYRQLGQHARARELYDRIIAADPGSVFAKEARYNRLVSLYSADDPDVVKEADAFLADAPESTKRDQVTLLKAEALYKRGEYAAAAPVYRSLDRSALPDGLKAEAKFKLGWCHSLTGEFAAAAEAFTAFLERNPTHKLAATALAQRATANQQLKNYDAALADFDAIIRKHPKAKERELAMQQKGLVLGQRQDNKGMAEAFRALLKEYPKSAAAAQAHYWIGWAAFEAKDYGAAIPELEAARKLDRDQFGERAALRIMLSHYYLEHRDPLAAEVAAYRGGGGKGAVPGEILRWLGVQFFQAKDFARAGEHLAALAAQPAEARADDWLLLARARLQAGEAAGAAAAAGSFLEKADQAAARAAGLNVLGRALLALGKLDEGRKAAEDACLLQPEGRHNAEGRILLGDIARARGDAAGAAKIFSSVAVVFDDPAITPQALEKAYRALLDAGKDQEAAKTLNTLQSRYPEYRLGSG